MVDVTEKSEEEVIKEHRELFRLWVANSAVRQGLTYAEYKNRSSDSNTLTETEYNEARLTHLLKG